MPHSVVKVAVQPTYIKEASEYMKEPYTMSHDTEPTIRETTCPNMVAGNDTQVNSVH